MEVQEKPKNGYNPETYRAWYLRNAEKKRQYGKDYYAANRGVKIAKSKQYRIDNPGCWAASHRKRLYGLTNEEVSVMAANQGFCCAICESPFDEARKSKKMNIDHDHATGAVRGLLCHTCNIALGWLERPGFHPAAMKYLEASK